MLKEFKEFAMRGHVLDMAIGIIIGGAFGTITQSLVKDVLMPPIGLLLGEVDFADLFLVLQQGTTPGPYPMLAAAQEAGAVTINYGLFTNSIVSFLIVAAAVFALVKGINEGRRKEENVPPSEPTTRACPFCISLIPIKAIRCPNCTSDLQGKHAA
ncbi:MAG: large conductance mechanosensitive channel protein MscL [Acidobacteriota bacterium]